MTCPFENARRRMEADTCSHRSPVPETGLPPALSRWPVPEVQDQGDRAGAQTQGDGIGECGPSGCPAQPVIYPML